MAYVKKIWIEGDDVTPVEMNNIEDGIETVDLSLTAHKADYEYKDATVVSRQIRTTKQSNTGIVKFKLGTNLDEGSAITISLDGGATSMPLMKIDGITPVTKLKQGFHEVIADATFFTFVSKGDYSVGDTISGEALGLPELFLKWGSDNGFWGETSNNNDVTINEANGDTYALIRDRMLRLDGETGETITTRILPSNYVGSGFVFENGGVFVFNAANQIAKYDSLLSASPTAVASAQHGSPATMVARNGFVYYGAGTNNSYRKVNADTLVTVGNTGSVGGSAVVAPVVDASDNIYCLNNQTTNQLRKFNSLVSAVGVADIAGQTAQAIAIDENTGKLYIGTLSNRIYVYDLNLNFITFFTLSKAIGGITALCVDEEYVYAGDAWGGIHKTNINNPAQTSKINFYMARITRIATAPNGDLLVNSNDGRATRVKTRLTIIS